MFDGDEHLEDKERGKTKSVARVRESQICSVFSTASTGIEVALNHLGDSEASSTTRGRFV